MSPTDGALADHFFPSLRETGWVGLHDQLFEQSWQMNMKALERFPDADNTMNTAGWLASRANRRLDEARKLLVRALELNPIQPAYLDTLAEIDFASGNRDEAVRLSELALRYMPHDPMILRQHERFLNGPLPR
jgi:tetratricopeptide (TPR) repeat protein